MSALGIIWPRQFFDPRHKKGNVIFLRSFWDQKGKSNNATLLQNSKSMRTPIFIQIRLSQLGAKNLGVVKKICFDFGQNWCTCVSRSWERFGPDSFSIRSHFAIRNGICFVSTRVEHRSLKENYPRPRAENKTFDGT